jgi:dCTP deaminase
VNVNPGGILTGDEINAMEAIGAIEIDPFDKRCLNPVSVDLHLGENVAVYAGVAYAESGVVVAFASLNSGVLDARRDNPVHRFKIPEEGLVLTPGVLYLMHTLERVSTKRFVPVLDGKSSIGRLGIKVHETAGYGDPGFDGQYTLEVTCVHPVRIYAGMRFCQMRFHTMVGAVELYGVQPYKSNYVGVLAEGPVPSRAFKQFEQMEAADD